jgi:hypothetical protein
LQGLAATQTFELLLLQDAQKFWLQLKRKVANFVKKQSPTVSGLKVPSGLVNGARVCTALVAEEFTLDQIAPSN